VSVDNFALILKGRANQVVFSNHLDVTVVAFDIRESILFGLVILKNKYFGAAGDYGAFLHVDGRVERSNILSV